MRIVIGVLLVVVASVVTLRVVAARGWRVRTDALVAAMVHAPHRPAPGRFTVAELEGLLVPVAGEGEWLLPDGVEPYWRGELRGVVFEHD